MWAIVGIAAVATLGYASVATSTADVSRSEQLAREIRCPTCAGLSVAESTSPLAAVSREEIDRRVSEGQSDEEIRSYFVSRYGESALVSPERHGIALVVWLAPLFFALAGLAAVAYIVRRWSREDVPDADPVEFRPEDGGTKDAGAMDSGTADSGPFDSGPKRPVRVRRQIIVAVVATVFVAGTMFAVISASDDRTPDNVTGLLAHAQQLSAQGEAAEALETYDAVLELEPSNPTALAYRGWLIRLAGLPEEGLVSIERAIIADPDYPDAHFFKGIILLRDKNQPEQAVTELELFLAADPPPEMSALVEQALADARNQVANAG